MGVRSPCGAAGRRESVDQEKKTRTRDWVEQLTVRSRAHPLLRRSAAVSAALWVLGMVLATIAFVNAREIDAVIAILAVVFVSQIRDAFRHLTGGEWGFLGVLTLFAAWSVIPDGRDVGWQVVGAAQFGRAIALYMLMRSLIRDVPRVWRFVRIASLCALAVVAVSIGEYAVAQVMGYDSSTFSGGRLAGLGGNANYLSHWLVILLGLNAGGLIWMFRYPQGCGAYKLRDQIGIVGMISLASLLSLSRGAWAATAVVIAVTGLFLVGPVLRQRAMRVVQTRTVMLFTLLAGALVAAVLVNEAWMGRVVMLVAENEEEVRYELWSSAISWFADATLLQQIFGTGAWQFRAYIPGAEHNAHNSFILFLVAYGLLGLGLFLALMTRVFGAVLAAGGSIRYAALALAPALVFGLTNDTFLVAHYWVLVALLLVGTVVKDRPVGNERMQAGGAMGGAALPRKAPFAHQ